MDCIENGHKIYLWVNEKEMKYLREPLKKYIHEDKGEKMDTNSIQIIAKYAVCFDPRPISR